MGVGSIILLCGHMRSLATHPKRDANNFTSDGIKYEGCTSWYIRLW